MGHAFLHKTAFSLGFAPLATGQAIKRRQCRAVECPGFMGVKRERQATWQSAQVAAFWRRVAAFLPPHEGGAMSVIYIIGGSG
jgi:hypothetical protein